MSEYKTPTRMTAKHITKPVRNRAGHAATPKAADDTATGDTAGLLGSSVMGAQPELTVPPNKATYDTATGDTAGLLESWVMGAQPELTVPPDMATGDTANGESANDDTAVRLGHSTSFKDQASSRRTTTADLKITSLRFLSGV